MFTLISHHEHHITRFFLHRRADPKLICKYYAVKWKFSIAWNQQSFSRFARCDILVQISIIIHLWNFRACLCDIISAFWHTYANHSAGHINDAFSSFFAYAHHPYISLYPTLFFRILSLQNTSVASSVSRRRHYRSKSCQLILIRKISNTLKSSLHCWEPLSSSSLSSERLESMKSNTQWFQKVKIVNEFSCVFVSSAP